MELKYKTKCSICKTEGLCFSGPEPFDCSMCGGVSVYYTEKKYINDNAIKELQKVRNKLNREIATLKKANLKQ